MPNWPNLLPDWKGALNNFYEEKIATTIEQKSTEYKELLTLKTDQFQEKIKQFQTDHKRFQNTVLIILLTGLTLTTIHYFWTDDKQL